MRGWAHTFLAVWSRYQLDKSAPVVLALMVTALVAHAFAELSWRLAVVELPELSEPAVPVTAARPAFAAQVPLLSPQVIQQHLFGEVRQDAPQPVAAAETAPETRLNLKLLGVFSSTNSARARAIIADSRGQEEMYAVGTNLPGGVKLHSVLKDRVLLERNGRLETLKLPEDESLGFAVPGMDSDSEDSGDGNSAPPPLVVGGPSVGDTGGMLRHYREQLVNDPQSAMGLIRTEPVNRDGRLVGWRLGPGRDRQLLQKFGLRPGDIVTAVNGVAMDNPVKALEILRDLPSANQLAVDIERNGVQQSFVFRID